MNGIKDKIINGQTILGIEFGSTRIKAVLIDKENKPIASGNFDWENKLINNIWSYDIADVLTGLQECYKDLKTNVLTTYNIELEQISAIGISGMMHGYLVLDENEELLAPFRTWRNTMTEEASNELTELFSYNIPQRFSISHLYQSILNKESHIPNIKYQTTLAGYIHLKLTGEKVLGVGEASGMFPIDIKTKQFDLTMMEKFDKKIDNKLKLSEIFPKVLNAGAYAGKLTEEGAKLLDVSGKLKAGIPFCPPEGDAGTGMVATNSITQKTGNVSAGTSVFAMVVLEKNLTKVYPEIDLVTTPNGHLVAMVHCNNCTSDLNAWVNIFKEFLDEFKTDINTDTVFTVLYKKALEADVDAGGLLAYNYLSGEHITGMDSGRPLFVRTPDSIFNLANFMRVHLYTSLGALKVGLDILLQKENVKVDSILGHGGLFKTKEVGQSILASAIGAPVSVMETASEGGAWGIAILASYLVNNSGETLDEFLQKQVFCNQTITTIIPKQEDIDGFDKFIQRYKAGLDIEKTAIEKLK